MTEIKTIPAFDKDIKRLAKKYSSIESDVERLAIALSVVRQNEIRGTVRIANPGAAYDRYPVYKIRSFRCVALKGKGSNSGIRVIYYDDESADCVTLIEIYCKSQQENHTVKRICDFLDSLM